MGTVALCHCCLGELCSHPSLLTGAACSPTRQPAPALTSLRLQTLPHVPAAAGGGGGGAETTRGPHVSSTPHPRSPLLRPCAAANTHPDTAEWPPHPPLAGAGGDMQAGPPASSPGLPEDPLLFRLQPQQDPRMARAGVATVPERPPQPRGTWNHRPSACSLVPAKKEGAACLASVGSGAWSSCGFPFWAGVQRSRSLNKAGSPAGGACTAPTQDRSLSGPFLCTRCAVGHTASREGGRGRDSPEELGQGWVGGQEQEPNTWQSFASCPQILCTRKEAGSGDTEGSGCAVPL